MTYQSAEQSTASARPVECYDIAMGSTHWRINPSPVDIVYGGYTYSHAICKRTNIQQTSEIPKDSIELELPENHELVEIVTRAVPEQEISLTIYRGHGSSFVTFWRGYLNSISVDGNNVPKLRFAPLSSDLPSVGMRRPIQRLCPHILYGARCGVDEDDFKVTGVIDAIDGLVLTSSSFADALWSYQYEGSGQGIAYPDLTGLTGCVYSGNNYGDKALAYANAFDDKLGPPSWFSGRLGGAWISCYWTTPLIINRIRIQPCPWTADPYYKWQPLYVKIQASNNGDSWTNLTPSVFIDNCSAYESVGGVTVDAGEQPYVILLDLLRNYTTWAEFEVSNSSAYSYYRVWCFGAWFSALNSIGYIQQYGGDYGIGIGEIEMTNVDNDAGDYPELTNGLTNGLFVTGDSKRMIVLHEGEDITLDRFIPDLQVGASFTAYAGCDHAPNTCRFVFNNILNFGGFEFLPIANPYTGNIYY